MLVARHITKAYADRTLFEDVSLVVSPGASIGLVGPNGIGKSTLLRILAGVETADAGTVTTQGLVGYLPQRGKIQPGETILDLLARRTGVAAAESELARREAALPAGIEEHAEALERFLGLGGSDLAARAGAVCADVGLRAGLDREVSTLSGGEAARVALAAVLLARFDVFLLDEPTNDLDFAGLDRLERFVAETKGAVVVVSHDRAFLERTTREVLELEAETGRAAHYAGGFAEWQRMRGLAREHEQRAWERYVDRRAGLQAQAQQQREWARTGVAKASKGRTDNAKMRWGAAAQRAENRGAEAARIERELARLETAPKPWRPWELRLSLPAERRGGDLVVRLEHALVEREGFHLGPVEVDLRWRDRLAIVGRNGSGKSTLIDALLGRTPLAAGRRSVGPGTRFGTIEQSRAAFDSPRPLVELFAAEANLAPGEARALLAKLGLGAEDVLRSASSLSPGERTRAELALIAARGVNCLVLDEPTNHLDLEAIEQLEAAVSGFDGTLVVVSHDRRFLESVAPTNVVDAETLRSRRA